MHLPANGVKQAWWAVNMPLYEIQAPNGKKYRISGPAGASDDDVRTQVLAQFPEAAGAPTAPTPSAQPADNTGTIDPATRALNVTVTEDAFPGLQANHALSIYNAARNNLADKLPAEKRAKAMRVFDADPRIQQIRRAAGLTPLRTKQDEVRDIARRNLAERERAMSKYRTLETDREASFGAGVNQGFLFSAPQYIEAAARHYLPGGQAQGNDFSEELNIVRAEDELQAQRSSGGNIAGSIVGALGTGGPATGLVKAGAAKLSASGVPIAAKAGNVLQRLSTLEKAAPGTKLTKAATAANIGKVATAGAAAGGAQALGEGQDIEGVAKSTALGAVAPIALGGTAKAVIKGVPALARKVTRPFSSDIEKAAREVISENPSSLASRHAALSAQVGENVPLVAALKDHDYEQVAERVVQRSPEALQIAKTRVGEHIKSFMDRMLSHVNNAGKTADAEITTIGDLAQKRRDTATEIMAPVRDKSVSLTALPLAGIERTLTQRIGGRIQGLGQRLDEALGSAKPDNIEALGVGPDDEEKARALLAYWGLGSPQGSKLPQTATVAEMDTLRRVLDKAAKGASNAGNEVDSLAYANASKTIRDFVGKKYPQYEQMISTYAAHSRMMEGFNAGAAGTRAADVEDTLLRGNLKSPEGVVGMKAGELFRQREAVSASPSSAIRQARDYAAEGGLTRPASAAEGAARPGTITENLGGEAAANLASASQGETAVLQRMLDTGKLDELIKNEQGAISPHEIAYGAFLSGAMPVTKARFAVNFLKPLNEWTKRLSSKAAENLTEMLFSRDPAQTQKALNALKRVGLSDRTISKAMSNALQDSISAGAAAGNYANRQAPKPEDTSIRNPVPEPLPSDQLPESTSPDAGLPSENVGDSPYSAMLDQVRQTENPQVVELVDRVEKLGEKSRQDQVSPAGAVGVMQIMPGTGPEAAKLAGLPWDEQAARTDESYSRLLGIAYLTEMLHVFEGDAMKAVAAYNAGPGSVKAAVRKAGENWLSALPRPQETIPYVQRVFSL